MLLHNDPNWMRAGHWFSQSDDSSIYDLGILGVGASKSAITPNQAYKTPNAIREALLRYSTYFAEKDIDLTEKIKAVDLGDLPNPDSQPESIDLISKKTVKSLVLLGGDNSITYSGVMALGKKADLKEIGLITLDAHHDLRDGIVGNQHSCIFDSDLTMVIGNTAKVVGWYDNETGYSSRVADLIARIGA